MSKIMLIAVILIPVLTGVLVPVIPFRKRRHMEVFLEAGVVFNTLLVWSLLGHRPTDSFILAKFTGDLAIAFRVDGMGMVFAGLVSFLWPLATLFSFEYMTKEKHEKIFFMFYTITYGVTLGIALADNILTMYFFYELLTLVTVPLVMHTLTREAILASRKYLYYSLGGAAFAFIGMIFIIIYGTTTEFVLGGVLDMGKIGNRGNILLLIYVIAFMGFGVKAAICPFNSWLPQAGVAPTPVTALLHAVAVVKAGAFAILRLTYYSFGADFLRGTWAQYVVMGIVMFTIVYGCSRAVKETHLKRRLAYSTISNLSYILFGATIMTPLGMVGALAHMVFHAFMKICSFFCAGAVMHQTGKTQVYELDGLGKSMPVTFGCLAVASFSLMGIPLFGGFISKWNLVQAAFACEGSWLPCAGVAVILYSALMTGIYMLTVLVRACFPKREKQRTETEPERKYRDPGWMMLVPLLIFAALILFWGLHSSSLMRLLTEIGGEAG